MPRRTHNNLFMSGRIRREMLAAFESEDWATFGMLKDQWLRHHKRMPKGLRLADTNPKAHGALQARHNTNPSRRTLSREAHSARVKKLRADAKARRKRKEAKRASL